MSERYQENWSTTSASGRRDSLPARLATFLDRHQPSETVILVATAVVVGIGAGLAAILFSLDLNTVQPSTAGNMYELYAIAGCVVGGVSLKGGEGNILGVIIGVAIVRVLYNAINILGIATQLEFAVVGLVIMIGVGADEMIKSIAAKRRLQEVRGGGPSQPDSAAA